MHKKHIKFKTPKRFRLSFYNENTLNRIWTLKMSRGRMILSACVLFILLTAFFIFIFRFTPLKKFFPGELSVDERQQLVQNSQTIDSLINIASINDTYITNLKAIFSDDLPVDSIHNLAEISKVAEENVDSLLAVSETEREFVRHYEERDKYNLAVLSPILSESMNFSAPIKTAEVVAGESPTRPKFNLKADNNGIDAIYRGTVIDSYYTPSSGYVVIISHPNDFVSRYSGLTDVYVRKGEKVKAGSRIGSVNLKDSGLTNAGFNFEMWQNGLSLNPLEFIIFT